MKNLTRHQGWESSVNGLSRTFAKDWAGQTKESREGKTSDRQSTSHEEGGSEDPD
jgi:hypothetical protein